MTKETDAIRAIDAGITGMYLRQMALVNMVRARKGLPPLPTHPDAAGLAGAIANAEFLMGKYDKPSAPPQADG